MNIDDQILSQAWNKVWIELQKNILSQCNHKLVDGKIYNQVLSPVKRRILFQIMDHMNAELSPRYIEQQVTIIRD